MTKWVDGLNIHLKSLIYGLSFVLVLVIAICSMVGIMYAIVSIPYHLGLVAFFLFCAYYLGKEYVVNK